MSLRATLESETPCTAGTLGFGIGTVAAGGYGLVVLTACLLPETKGASLREVYAAA